MRRLKFPRGKPGSPPPLSKDHVEKIRRAFPKAFNHLFDTGRSGPAYPADTAIWMESYWKGDAYWSALKRRNRWNRAVDRAKLHLGGTDQTNEPWYPIPSERRAFDEAIEFLRTQYLPALNALVSGEGNR